MTKKIAIPMSQDRPTSHFGGADSFLFLEMNEETGSIDSKEKLAPPPHERGVFPRWLKQKGVDAIIAGGMGPRAQTMFSGFGIDLAFGLDENSDPESLAKAYFKGELPKQAAPCGGGFHDCGQH